MVFFLGNLNIIHHLNGLLHDILVTEILLKMVVSSIIPFFCVNELLPFGQHHRKIQMVAVKYLNVAKINLFINNMCEK